MSLGLPVFSSIGSTDVGACVATLRKYGVLVIERWVIEGELEQLIFEHERVFAGETAAVDNLNHYRPGIGSRAVRLITKQIADVLPGTFRFLAGRNLCAIARGYLGESAAINHAAYMTLDVAHSTPVTRLHYDRKHALKAFLCLTSADGDCGAPAFVPGSHCRGKIVREYHIATGVSESDLPITSGHDGQVAISMDSPAGSLVIFDTDCLHSGGTVMPGRTRRVLRGHSHSR